ncbi:MAG: aspartate aminotransferase family protein, partial [Chloroflexota bacterium]
MRKLLEDAAQRAIRYLEELDSRSVAPDAVAIAGLDQLDGDMPDKTGDPVDTLRMLDELCSPATMGNAGRRFYGFVIGGSLPVTLAANWLAG